VRFAKRVTNYWRPVSVVAGGAAPFSAPDLI
jgi:hypothetical protein